MKHINSEQAATYQAAPAVDDNATITKALAILESRLQKTTINVTSPDAARDFLILKTANLEWEEFSVMFLSNRHKLLGFESIFRGTIDGASVWPREIVRAALKHNAAAVILSHNHPSGEPEPSQADIRITARLQEALALIDVRVLDHIVVGGMQTVSLAERGLI